MRRRIFICIIFILATLHYACIGPANIISVAGAELIYVPDVYSTIQSAVNHASVGDTIIVRDGIYIENVTVDKPLAIRSENGPTNCIIHATAYSDYVFNITSNNVTISGFTVNGTTKTKGIYLEGAEHCILENNIVSNHRRGIFLLNSVDNVIANNTVLNNTKMESSGQGIVLIDSINNTITDNNASNNGYGICLIRSINDTITDNTVSSNLEGIYLKHSSNSTVKNNTMSGNKYNLGVDGSKLSHFMHKIDSSNEMDGRPVYYLVNEKDVKIPRDAGFTGIINSSDITVENLSLMNNRPGVLLAYSENCRIENINASNNTHGIRLYSSSNITIINNAVSNNFWGIHLMYSSNNTITKNTASNNVGGIQLMFSSNNTITRNTASNNEILGIGICLDSCNNTIINNAVSNNFLGIHLVDSSNNIIYLNNFINNSFSFKLSFYQIFLSNAWNSTFSIKYIYNGSGYENYMGNFWSDYEGDDANGDGIGDTPYIIDEDIDLYPLIETFDKYLIDNTPPETTISPDEGTYSEIITITLTALDEGCGVYETYNKISDVGEWIKYKGPFNISESGTYTIYYYSIDKLENNETVKSVTYMVDITPPTISVNIDPSEPKTKQTVSFTVTANDNAGGTGIAKIDLYVDDEHIQTWTIAGTHGYIGGPYSRGTHTYYVEATDNVGNSAREPTIESNTFTVTLSFPLGWLALALVAVIVTVLLILVRARYRFR